MRRCVRCTCIMDLFSLQYFLFITIGLLVYYLLPRLIPAAACFQWVILLAASLAFYASSSGWTLLLLLTTAASIYGGGRLLAFLDADFAERKKKGFADRAQQKAFRGRLQHQKRLVLAGCLLLNFGILAWLKYFAVLLPGNRGILLPLGISFYTFQSVSYLIDVYNGKYAAEKSFPRFVLFVSWFPQLLQGPIGRYDRLQEQLLARHRFDGEGCKRALLLILFGLMKKYAVADMLSGSIAAVLDYGNIGELPGSLIVFSILLYSAQQYADFSGGIDIVTGVSALFGVELACNFRQPYFSVSLGDFWRRWHISLGAWMRDYLFYPFALLKPMQRFGKWCMGRFGKNGRHLGRVLPAGIANLVVFLVVGIWHGPQLHYVLWGLYNGLVIALSDLTEPFWKGLAGRMHWNTDSRGVHLFRIVRTFLIVNIGWYFDRITDAGECMQAFAATFLHFQPAALIGGIQSQILKRSTAFNIAGGYALAALGLAVVFAVSLQRERGMDVYARFQEKPFPLRAVLLAGMMLMVAASFLFTESAGGFMYANF